MKPRKNKEEIGIDAPLHHPDADCLDRAIFAQRIFKIVEGTPTSTNMTVGILGTWGSGKTTAMNFLRHYCQEAGHPTATFNPWQFHSREEAWKGFVASIDRGIAAWQGKAVGSFKRQRTIKKASEVVRKLTAETTVGKIAGTLVLKPLEGALEETKERVQKELDKALQDKRLFVFIDDLDRAEPEIVYDMLMLLNEIVDLNRCIYVIGLDEKVAAQLINKKTGLNLQESKEFLDKIIKWPFHLPEPTDFEWQELLDREIKHLDKNVKKGALQSIYAFLPKNPRRFKHFLRYISGLHKSFLSRFDDYELNWKVLYLAQLLRIEFPEVFRKIIDDKPILEDLTAGIITDSLRGQKNSTSESKPEWTQKIATISEDLSAHEKERLFSLYGELRSAGGIISIEHLRNHFLVVETPDLFTWKEYREFKKRLLPLADDALKNKLVRLVREGVKSKQIEQIREFIKTLIRDRETLLSRAADAVDQEAEMKPLISEAKQVMRICFLLLDIDDIFIGHNPIFNKEVFEEWYKQLAQWAHFRNPEHIYSEIRQLESDLAKKLAHKISFQASQILEILPSYESDPFGHKKFFEATHEEVKEVLEKALLEEVIDRFTRIDGIDELNKGPRIYRAERRLLFQLNPIMDNTAVYARLKSIAMEAAQNPNVQKNFYEYMSMLFYAATEHLDWTDKAKVIDLLKKKEFIDIVWNATVARPMNLRAVGSLEQKRKMIVQEVLKDERALPIPRWYEDLIKEVKDKL